MNIGVSRAIEHQGLSTLASKLGVTYQAVRKWQKTRPPGERCRAIVAATNGAVSLTDLRPDLWPASDQAA